MTRELVEAGWLFSAAGAFDTGGGASRAVGERGTRCDATAAVGADAAFLAVRVAVAGVVERAIERPTVEPVVAMLTE